MVIEPELVLPKATNNRRLGLLGKTFRMGTTTNFTLIEVKALPPPSAPPPLLGKESRTIVSRERRWGGHASDAWRTKHRRISLTYAALKDVTWVSVGTT